MVVLVVDGGDESSLDVFAVYEVMNEDDTAGCARPPSLIEEEVAKTVVNSAIFIKFKSLGLVSSGTNYDVCAKADEFAEESDLVAGG